MRIALVHNLRRSPAEAEAEFDTPETVDFLLDGLRAIGHDVCAVDAGVPLEKLIVTLRAQSPELIFNTAEGHDDPFREAFFPALFERLGIPYTGSAPYACGVTLDKHITKLIANELAIPVARSTLAMAPGGYYGDLTMPVIVKPNFEGSSIGITPDSIVERRSELAPQVDSWLRRFPAGVLVEEYIQGTDLVVPYLEGIGDGVLTPVGYRLRSDSGQGTATRAFFDLDRKLRGFADVDVEVPASLPRSTRTAAQEMSRALVRRLGLRDVARFDYRVTEHGELVFLEVNALPSLERGASIYLSAALAGLSTPSAVLGAIVESAVRRIRGPASPRTIARA